jgi:hypothetical protein
MLKHHHRIHYEDHGLNVKIEECCPLGQFFMAVTIKDIVFWDMMLCGSSKKN